MIKLRSFLSNDAETIVKWVKSEREFKMWCADQYNNYPLCPEEIIKNYEEKAKKEQYIPLMFEENGEAVGHLILRFPHPISEPDMIRLGFIIVNDSYRNKGYGKRIILYAMQYAIFRFNVNMFNLGVFSNNVSAYRCYKKIGFRTICTKENFLNFHGENWNWEEMIFNPFR